MELVDPSNKLIHSKIPLNFMLSQGELKVINNK